MIPAGLILGAIALFFAGCLYAGAAMVDGYGKGGGNDY